MLEEITKTGGVVHLKSHVVWERATVMVLWMVVQMMVMMDVRVIWCVVLTTAGNLVHTTILRLVFKGESQKFLVIVI